MTDWFTVSLFNVMSFITGVALIQRCEYVGCIMNGQLISTWQRRLGSAWRLHQRKRHIWQDWQYPSWDYNRLPLATKIVCSVLSQKLFVNGLSLNYSLKIVVKIVSFLQNNISWEAYCCWAGRKISRCFTASLRWAWIYFLNNAQDLFQFFYIKST